MSRFLTLLAVLAFANPCLGSAQDKETPEKQDSPEVKLKADPNDTAALNAYFGSVFQQIGGLIDDEKFDEAEQTLKAAEEFVAELKPTESGAKSLVTRFGSFRRSYQSRIDLARTPLDELKQALEATPDDSQAFQQVVSKYTMQMSPLARTEPDMAEAILNEAKAYFASLEEKHPDNDTLKKLITNSARSFSSFERAIETAKKHLALIGQDVPPLSAGIQAWANGGPLPDSDLQGKVVLLDFWAVWCGPCIATFPHLREWKAKYGEQGFEIVGITNYYKYKWDDEANRAVRAKQDEDMVTPEQEQEMLKKFAELHELSHPFAIQDAERTLSEHFSVSGIPTAALVDRQGKIRLIRVGSGEANAREIEQLIEKLIRE
jgi:thiol-disulfide isomerase/thioredoxin